MKLDLTLLKYCFVGGITVFGVSLLNSGFASDRSLISYLLPVLVGGVAGGIAGWLNQSLCREQDERETLFIEIISSLAATLEERDSYTHGHAQRVSQYGQKLGQYLGLSSKQINHLRLATILHDIGKIGIPDQVLLKQGKLNESELATIRPHPDKGVRILEHIHDPRMSEVILAVRHHHEQFDGNGYPLGLKGDQIPLLARILSLADSFDAMTSNRPYRKGMPIKQALSEILNCAGTQFDPKLAHLFIEVIERDTDPMQPKSVSSKEINQQYS